MIDIQSDALEILKSRDNTELEKRLFAHILFLMSAISVYEITLNNIHITMSDAFNWQYNNLTNIQMNDKYKAMTEELNREFNWNLTLNSLDKKENDNED